MFRSWKNHGLSYFHFIILNSWLINDVWDIKIFGHKCQKLGKVVEFCSCVFAWTLVFQPCSNIASTTVPTPWVEHPWGNWPCHCNPGGVASFEVQYHSKATRPSRKDIWDTRLKHIMSRASSLELEMYWDYTRLEQSDYPRAKWPICRIRWRTYSFCHSLETRAKHVCLSRFAMLVYLFNRKATTAY